MKGEIQMTDLQRVLNFLESEGINYHKDFWYSEDEEEITDIFIDIDDSLHFKSNGDYDI